MSNNLPPSWDNANQGLWFSRAQYLKENNYAPGWSVSKIAERLWRADMEADEEESDQNDDPYSLAWKLDAEGTHK